MSTPAEDDSFRLFIIDIIPDTENVIDGMKSSNVEVGMKNGGSVSFVNTDPNALLKMFAQSTSLTGLPSSSVKLVGCVD